MDASDTLTSVRKVPPNRFTAQWGAVGMDHIDWRVALEHYEAERLEEAYETAVNVGVGSGAHYVTWFRTIEAEFQTSELSNIETLRPNLELEYVEEEASDFLEDARRTTISAIEEMGRRFAYSHESPTRVSVLASETDAPWLYGRYGYCTLKEPFYKICVPHRLLLNEKALFDTLRHEYAHVIVGTLSEGRAPRWLDEAMAMVAEGGIPAAERRRFARGEEDWLGHEELEADLRDLEDSRDKYLAYMQAGLVGEYLVAHYGEPSLGEMLRGFSDHSYWRELWLRIRGTSSEEEAIDQIYKLTLVELFDRAERWVKG